MSLFQCDIENRKLRAHFITNVKHYRSVRPLKDILPRLQDHGMKVVKINAVSSATSAVAEEAEKIRPCTDSNP